MFQRREERRQYDWRQEEIRRRDLIADQIKADVVASAVMLVLTGTLLGVGYLVMTLPRQIDAFGVSIKELTGEMSEIKSSILQIRSDNRQQDREIGEVRSRLGRLEP